VPYKQPESMERWHALSDKLKSSPNRIEGLVELAPNIWLIPMPTGIAFLSLIVWGAQSQKLKARIAFLEDEVQWTDIPALT